jgi:hypothetical protein
LGLGFAAEAWGIDSSRFSYCDHSGSCGTRQRLKLLADAPEIASADYVSLAITWRKCLELEFASEDKLRCFRGVNRPRWTAHPIARMRECLFGEGCVAQSGIIEGGNKALPYNSCTGERWNPGMGIKRGRHQYATPVILSLEPVYSGLISQEAML